MLKKLILKLYPSRIFMGVVVGIIIGTIIVVVGGFSGENKTRDYFLERTDEVVEVTGEIYHDPDFSGKNGSLKLKNLEVNGENMHGVIYLSGLSEIDADRGDRLTVRGKAEEGFGTFVASFYRPEVLKISRAEPRSLLLRLRNKLASAAGATIGGEKETRLGLAYLLGLRNGLDDETLEILKLVGLAHIVVASGTHLGILVGLFKKYFGKVSRFAGLLFSLLFILIFSAMIGWTASITRAAIVATLAILAWYSGRIAEAWRIILIAMAATLLIDPMNLVNLGWLLSFASFIGIMILAPIMTEFFYGKVKPWESKEVRDKKRPSKVAEIVIASVAATVMCAPILVYFFGRISLISIVANVLILPTIPVAMGLTFVSGIVGMLPRFFLFDIMRWIFGNGTRVLIDYHLAIMEFFSKQVSFIIELPKNDARVFLAYVVILTPFVVYLVRNSVRKRRLRARINQNPKKYIHVAED